jgi:hypothetical protein
MGRKVLAVIVAMIVAWAIIMISQMLNAVFIMPPAADVMANPERLREYIASMPTSVYIVVLIGYVVASFAGGFIATKMARHVGGGFVETLIVAAILELMAIVNFFVTMPGQPIWFIVASLLCFFPLALLGHRLAR